MKKQIVVLAMAMMLALGAGCSLIPSRSRNVTVPVEQGQTYEVTIVEGQTTKQQVIDALGMPKSLSDSSMSYSFRNKDICKLKLTHKDGTSFNVILGQGKQYKYDDMDIYMDEKTGIINSVRL